jgi:hypothetical protein
MNTWTILVGQDEYDEDNIFLFKSIDKNSLGQGVLIDPNQAGYVNTKEFEPYESITHTSWDSLNHAGTLIKKDGSSLGRKTRGWSFASYRFPRGCQYGGTSFLYWR